MFYFLQTFCLGIFVFFLAILVLHRKFLQTIINQPNYIFSLKCFSKRNNKVTFGLEMLSALMFDEGSLRTILEA